MKKRAFGEGKRNGIGGKIDTGETVEQAMLRETKEEIGVSLTSYEQMDTLTYDEYYKGNHEYVTMQVFVADAWEGEPDESEEMNPAWFTIEKIPYEEMWADDIYCLPYVLAGEKPTGHFALNPAGEITSQSVQREGRHE